MMRLQRESQAGFSLMYVAPCTRRAGPGQITANQNSLGQLHDLLCGQDTLERKATNVYTAPPKSQVLQPIAVILFEV